MTKQQTTATSAPVRDIARQYIQLSVPREPAKLTDSQRVAYVGSIKALMKNNFSIELRAGVTEGESNSKAKTFAIELQAAAKAMATQGDWPGTIRYSTFSVKPQQTTDPQSNSFSALADLFKDEG